MNERIRALAHEAGLPTYNPDGIPTKLEKFAELIVRECVEVCNSRVGNSDYNTGRMHCASDLKEHFGVEE